MTTPEHVVKDLQRGIDSFASEMREKGIHVGINGRCVCGVKWPCERSVTERLRRSRS